MAFMVPPWRGEFTRFGERQQTRGIAALCSADKEASHGFRLFAQGPGPAQARRRFHAGARFSERATLSRRSGREHAQRPPLDTYAPDRGPETEGALRRIVESVPARVQARRWPHQSRIRAAR